MATQSLPHFHFKLISFEFVCRTVTDRLFERAKFVMKFTLTLVFTLIVQHGIKLTPAAPAAAELVFENEIPLGKVEDMKSFRETYARRMKSFMNTSVDPCDDFYEYACGNFANVIEYLEVTRKRSNLLDIFFVLVDIVDKILQTAHSPEEEYYEELNKSKQFLDTCVAAKLWPTEPNEDYLSVVKEIGGFPAVDPTWNASEFDWFNMTAYLTRYGIVGLVKESIFLKHPFPPYYEVPKLGFDFDVYLENIATKQSQGYVYSEKVMRNLLTIYGVTRSKADKVIEEVVDFWRDVLTTEKLINDYGGCSMASLILDNLNSDVFTKWKNFFEIAWDTIEFNLTEISECPCDLFYIKLDTIARKKPKAVANYMALKFLHTLHPQMESSKFQRLHCVSRVKHAMPIVLSHFYMKQFYNKETEEDIFSIVSELKKSLQFLVETADWLDEPTREEALNKVRTLRARVGQIKDPITDTLIKEMKKLNFTDNFALNNLQLAKFEVDMHHYGYLHADIDESTAPMDILDVVQVNAFYYVLENSINVMAGVLHPPVYHPNLPESIKYGSLGYILGHELTHGLDNMGSNFDSNLTQRYWWSEKSGKVFDERSNCFADHYTSFKVPEIKRKLNGTTSQDENIADSGGLREALWAYRKVSKAAIKNNDVNFSQNESLPGLDLSPEQTFFLSFAQLYCSNYTAKHFWVEISDEHPLDKYRVLGSLQNFEEFPLVYNCPLGSPMNPNEKCRLW